MYNIVSENDSTVLSSSVILRERISLRRCEDWIAVSQLWRCRTCVNHHVVNLLKWNTHDMTCIWKYMLFGVHGCTRCIICINYIANIRSANSNCFICKVFFVLPRQAPKVAHHHFRSPYLTGRRFARRLFDNSLWQRHHKFNQFEHFTQNDTILLEVLAPFGVICLVRMCDNVGMSMPLVGKQTTAGLMSSQLSDMQFEGRRIIWQWLLVHSWLLVHNWLGTMSESGHEADHSNQPEVLQSGCWTSGCESALKSYLRNWVIAMLESTSYFSAEQIWLYSPREWLDGGYTFWSWE